LLKKNKNNFELIINSEPYEMTSILNIIDKKTGNNSNQVIQVEYGIWSFIAKKINHQKIEKVIQEEIVNKIPKIVTNINKPLEIKLRQIKTVIDISYMFSGCTTLESVENINWNTDNITNMAAMFGECRSLSLISDITKWNTSNVTTMNNMFSQCRKLKAIPDLSKWNIKNRWVCLFLSHHYCLFFSHE